MALTVNNNISSMNAQHNLQRSGDGLARAMERLSSGMRINRAGDDAAGLAISESLRSQIRGLTAATRNANDGISLVNTAEGAIQEVSNMLQRIRELAIQSGNDTNSAENRRALQLEVDQLIEELTRISTTAQFNGRNLFDGSFSNMKLQIGTLANQTLDISIQDLRAEKLGAIALKTSNAPTAALIANDLIINGTDIGATAADGVSFQNGTFSSIAMVNAINSKTSQTQVTAKVLANTKTGAGAIGAVNIDGTTNSMLINGVAIAATNVQANDADGALAKAINGISNTTGVTAAVDSAGVMTLTAEDGRNITLTLTGVAALNLGGNGTATTTGKYEIASNDTISISGNSPGDAGFASQTVSVDYNTAINTVDITTHAGANEAITIVDYAMEQILRNRAALGAITNRLEMTVSNLQTVQENLSASDSRIRDADFAYETAQMAKNQILQQAGTAILAQANLIPQAALQLLKG